MRVQLTQTAEEGRQGESGSGMKCVLERAACLHCLLAYYYRELWSKCWVPQQWYICISPNNIRYIWCPSLWNFTQRLQKTWAIFFSSEKILHTSFTVLISVEDFPNLSRSKRKGLGLSSLVNYFCLMVILKVALTKLIFTCHLFIYLHFKNLKFIGALNFKLHKIFPMDPKHISSYYFCLWFAHHQNTSSVTMNSYRGDTQLNPKPFSPQETLWIETKMQKDFTGEWECMGQ